MDSKSSENSSDFSIQATKQWLQKFVISHSLCPFAQYHLDQNTIQFLLVEACTEAELLESLEGVIHSLIADPSIETTLLIHPNALRDFNDYNQFLNLADGLLEIMGETDHFQIASFHPDYQFAGTRHSDPENFTNRSPFPMLHVLRQNSVTEALKHYANPEQIPANNILKMREIGSKTLESDFRKFCSSSD